MDEEQLELIYPDSYSSRKSAEEEALSITDKP